MAVSGPSHRVWLFAAEPDKLSDIKGGVVGLAGSVGSFDGECCPAEVADVVVDASVHVLR